MGNTQQLGTLVNGVTVDANGNVGIGGAVDASYKFKVTGTTLITGAATFSSYVIQKDYHQINAGAGNATYANTWSGTDNGFARWYSGGASIIQLHTNGTTYFNGGNVGIGTSSPWGKFNVYAGTNLSFVVQDAGIADTIELTNYSSAGGYRAVALNGSVVSFSTGTAGGGSATERMRITNGGQVCVNGTGGTSGGVYHPFIVKAIGSQGIWVESSTSDSAVFIDNNGSVGTIGVSYRTSAGYLPLRVSVGGGEKARFNTQGYFKASSDGGYYSATGSYHEFVSNTAGTNNTLFINTTTNNPYGPWIWLNNVSPNNTTQYFLAGTDSSQDKFFIYSNGSMYNRTGVYGTISDASLKENIVDATPKLDDILRLKVRNFNMIGDGTKQIGFIAQEFEEVFPAMVDTNSGNNGDTHKAIKTTPLIPILVKCIQELKAEIEILKNK